MAVSETEGSLKAIRRSWSAFPPIADLDSASATGPLWIQWTVVVSVWSMIAVTIYSGYAYVLAALALIRRM